MKMGNLGKVLFGTAVGLATGIAALALAPVTGGASLAAGAVLAAAGTGAATTGTVVAVGAAGAAAGAAGGAIIQHMQDGKKTEEKVRTAKTASFRDGVNEGKAQTVSEIRKYTDFCLATTALSYYVARCDGNISKEEQLEIDFDLDAIKKNPDIPDAVIAEIERISSNEHISFEYVTQYLDKVSIEALKSLKSDIDEIIEASDGISKEEEFAKQRFEDYLKRREPND